MTLFVATVTLIGATGVLPAHAQSNEDCYWDNSANPATLVCGEEGAGGGELPPTYWTAWSATGFCVGIAANEALLWERFLIDRTTSASLETEFSCVEPDWSVAWDEVAQVASAIGVPAFETAPPPRFGAVVGSPALLWYSGQSQILPITAIVTDPTGVVYGVEGRGWIEQITWNMGDGSSVSSGYRGSFDAAVGFGDLGNPEAQHTYETTSTSQGYPIDPDRCDLAFTPVSVTLTWTGEYRQVVGILSTTWTPVPANLDITETFEIPVREIRSWLTYDDYDPPDDECTWTSGG